MQALDFNGLIQQVRDGDAAAADGLQRMLRLAVGRGVRRAMQTEDYGTPVGQRTEGLLPEVATMVPSDAADADEVTAQRITQAICGQTMARLRSEGRSACETVFA